MNDLHQHRWPWGFWNDNRSFLAAVDAAPLGVTVGDECPPDDATPEMLIAYVAKYIREKRLCCDPWVLRCECPPSSAAARATLLRMLQQQWLAWRAKAKRK